MELKAYAHASLHQALNLLGAEYDDQVAALPDFVHIPDEIALTFYESLLLFRQEFPDEVMDLVDEIDRILEGLKGPNDFWTLEALKGDNRWDDLRMIAATAMTALRMKPYPIDTLKGVIYVREPDLNSPSG